MTGLELESIGLHVLLKGLQQQDLPLTLGLRPLCDRTFPFVLLPDASPAHRSRVGFYHAVIPTASRRTAATRTSALERCAFNVVSLFFHPHLFPLATMCPVPPRVTLLKCLTRAADLRGMLAQHETAIMRQHGQGGEGKLLVGGHPQSCNGSWQSRSVRPCLQAPGTLNPPNMQPKAVRILWA